MLDGLQARMGDVRWAQVLWTPYDEITDDEFCAMTLRCPCYSVLTLVAPPCWLLGAAVQRWWRACTGNQR